ncbi:MAG: sugar ABC transporter ATP-binding protein [Microbispora sp.]|nr:sugar ABC transporter ATP-binding protein [Microbispora sp.]
MTGDPAAHPAGEPRPAVAVRQLSKTFLGQRALRQVSFDVRPGEVHALLGENGSGKSTLIKCLAGYHEPDEGAIVEIDGRPMPLPYGPAEATAAGLLFVHQDLGLIPTLTVAENFAINRGFDTAPMGRIDWPDIRRRARAELAVLGHDVPVDRRVGRLPVAEQTIVAIARALAGAGRGARMLVLDEPTAALPDAETKRLLAAVRQVVANGVGVVYVSHKLHEILEIADRATVLRDGRVVATVDVPGMSEQDLVRLIVGHDLPGRTAASAGPRTKGGTRGAASRTSRPADARTGEELLSVSGLRGHRLRGVSFSVRRGEVVGIAGMLGSGRSELARLLFGAQRPVGGEIRLRGTPVRHRTPRDAVRDGVALIPEDRRREGGFLQMPVSRNLTLPAIRRFWRKGRIAGRAERSCVDGLIAEFRVSPAAPERRFGVLSGGNQQKVVIAKWFNTRPDLVIFDEPVQGVDVGAKEEIFGLVSEAAGRGAGVLLISSELDEMLGLCDRVLVLRDGELVADLPGAGLDRTTLTRLVYFGTGRSAETSDSASTTVERALS